MRSNQALNRAPRQTRSAFTLIEMMITLTLVSIATAMAMPRINYTAYRVDMGARGLRVAMQRAQAFAVSSQHNELVAIDVAGGVAYVVDDANNNLAADPGERVTTVPLQDGVVFAEPTSTWVGAPAPTGAVTGPALTTVTINGLSMPGFIFRCDGASSTDVQIYLSSKRGLETDSRGVAVTQATGRTDWYKDMGSSTWMAGGF